MLELKAHKKRYVVKNTSPPRSFNSQPSKTKHFEDTMEISDYCFFVLSSALNFYMLYFISCIYCQIHVNQIKSNYIPSANSTLSRNKWHHWTCMHDVLLKGLLITSRRQHFGQNLECKQGTKKIFYFEYPNNIQLSHQAFICLKISNTRTRFTLSFNISL